MSDIINRIREVWKNMSIVQKGILFGVLAVLIISAGVYIYAGSNQRMVPLFYSSNASAAETSAIITQLDGMGLQDGKDYKLGDDGITIYVNETEAPRLRIDLAGSGVLPESGVGFEIFDSLGFAATEADRKIAQQRALMGELQKAINSYDEVEYSKVILNMPQDKLFSNEEQQGSASVVVALRPGYTLTQNQVKGIAYLVASAVDGISIGNVTITDQAFNPLSEFLTDEANMSPISSQAAQNNYESKIKFEKDLSKKLTGLLEQVLGPNKAAVTVYADLDFDAKEKTVIKYDNPRIRSYLKDFSAVAGAVPPVGIGPVDNNTQYPVDNTGNLTSANTEYYDMEVNYEMDSDTEHSISAPGGVRNISTSVVVDGDMNQQEVDVITNIAKAAVGFTQNRGDQINVAAVTFNRDQQLAEQAAFEKEQKRAQLIQTITMVAQYLGVAGAIALLLVTFFTLRRRLNRTNAILDEEDAAEMEVFLAGQQAMQPITVDDIIEDASLRLKPQKEDVTEKEIKQFANDSPDKVADIIKTWILKDEG